MPTTTPDAPVALTIRDVIQSNRRYTPEQIAERLGIFPNVFDNHKLHIYPEISEQYGSGWNLQLNGGQVAAAVERLEREGKLTVEITELAKKEYATRQSGDPDKLHPEDILEADTFYGDCEIRIWLDTPHGFINDKVVSYHSDIFTRQLGAGANLKVLGADICRFIGKMRVHWTITSAGLQAYRNRQRRQASPPKPKSVADRAVDLLEEQKQQEEQREREWQEHAWNRYLQLLLAGDDLPDEAVTEFANIMREFEITPEDVANDRNLCQKAIELEEQHDDRETSAKRIGPAREARNALRKQYENKLQEAEHNIRSAEQRARVCNEAGRKLAMLRKERPQFFTTTGVPPRLIDPTEQQAVVTETSD